MAPTSSERTGDIAPVHKEGEPLAKRRRTALACSACRARKSRCDGRRPSCTACISLTIECVYESSDYSTNVLVRKEHVADLERRLRDVERRLQRHDDLLTGHLSVCATDEGGRYGARMGDRQSISTVRPEQDNLPFDAINGEEDSGSDDTKTDGLAIGFVDEPTTVFYGDSSSILFTRCLLEAMSLDLNTKRTEMKAPCNEKGSLECNTVPVAQQQSTSVMPSPQNQPVSTTSLLSEREMDTLLDTYFNDYGSLFPFLHEPMFRDTYIEYKASGFIKASKGWLGVLTMIFAMATHINQSADVSAKYRFRQSHMLFQQAVSLCSELSMRTASLDIVQYLLLAVLYLQGTQRPIQTWMMHGMLVRTAMALGLHSEQAGQGLHPIQQEIRRRTWLTIYCVDKIQSVTCGRPPAIPDEYIVVKMPSPWVTMTETNTHNLNGPDIRTAFLDATVRLLQLVGRSVATQYGQNLGLRDHDMDECTAIQAASAMRQDLRRWASSLPSFLGLCEAGSEVLFPTENTESGRMRVILTLRYHFVNILIHRPLLCATLRHLSLKGSPTWKPLPYKIQLAVAEAHECIQSAEKTIEIVHAIIIGSDPSHTKLDVWFFTLFHVFNSALVILGRSVLERHGVYINDNATRGSVQSPLNQAVESLDKLDKDNYLVSNCARFIARLSQSQSDQDYRAPVAKQDNPGNGPAAQSGSEEFAYEQFWPMVGLPSLADPNMVPFPRGELLGHSFGEFSLSLDQLGCTH
ncbi:fungal-specific transcription factor domain-containing protein [Aspergillus granulosus]|uniref:Fungal-specific transcription factor domain-containing protein n=1 Tax=Aspergillus granulosus TaxID=176169 RepID=A0ABR4HN71_9EURO